MTGEAGQKILLAIDCGTQSSRVLLFSAQGELLDKVQIFYEPYTSPRPGWAEQDAEVFWESVKSACAELKTRHPQWFENIEGIGVTAQRASMVNVDAEGKPLRSVITWLDQRLAKKVYDPLLPLRLVYKAMRMEDSLAKIQMSAKSNWIQQNQPKIWENTHKYLQISGFLNHRLTGKFADSVASQIGHIPFSYKKQQWAASYELSSKLFPMKREVLPELVQPGGLIGTLSKKASQETGIPANTPVIACGSDKGCETVGMGVLDPSMASLSFGTTATVQTTTSGYCEAKRFIPPYPAVVRGSYNPEVEIFRGFWLISWFRNEFAHQEIQQAKFRNVPAEMVMNEMLKETPPGAMGLMVLPDWSPGNADPSAKGAMIGFGDVHKKAHVYRGVVEGLCYGLLDGTLKIEQATRQAIKTVAVSGGASQSPEICQIAADIFNRPLVRGETHETSGLGAAIVTAFGIGLYDSLGSAAETMVRYRETFNPVPEHARLYDQLFHRVYKKMSDTLAPLNEEIQRITGYPELAEKDAT